MLRTAIGVLLVATMTVSAATTALAQHDKQADYTIGRPIPARTIPLPGTVSPAMREWIAHPASPMYETLPGTDDQWRAAVKLHATARKKLLAEVRALCPVKIEPQSVGGVNCFLVTPEGLPEQTAGQLVLHLHGGAYVFNPGEVGAVEGVLLAHYGRTKVLSVDYRMPPDHPFPAALDDAVAVYQALLKTYKPADLGVFGTSAGGGLATAMLQRVRQLQSSLPAALGLGTPWADLSKSGDTLYTCEDIDQVLLRYDGVLGAAARLYAAGRDLADPQISPVNGDFAGFPPTILIAGTRDMLLSATVRVHRKLRQADVYADLHVFEGLSHGFYLARPDAPESREAFAEIAAFFAARLGK